MSRGRIIAVAALVVAAVVIGVVVTYLVVRPSSSTAERPAAETMPPPSYTPIFTGSQPEVSTFDMNGAFTLAVPRGSAPLKSGDVCQGSGMYADAKIGTPVKIFDANGKPLATGILKQGIFVDNPLGTACKFEFTVRNVPDGLPNYGIEIGSHGVQQVSSTVAHAWVSMTQLP